LPEPAPNPDADGLVGAITPYAGETLPGPKYRWCHGTQTLSRTEFSLCFSRLGERWGVGDGSTTFNLPNLDKKFLVGVDGTGGDAAYDEVGNTGGSATGAVSGTTSSDGAHQHDVILPTAGGQSGSGFTATQASSANTTIDGAHTHTFSGSADTVPPYAAVRFIIKVA
jgi:microcystin-dependent protein